MFFSQARKCLKNERVGSMKKRLIVSLIFAILIMVTGEAVGDNVTDWSAGGPKDIYVKPIKKSPYHGIYDESMKCLDCHRYDGVDSYTSATMSMLKSKKGSMSREQIQQGIIKALNRHGNYREIFVLSTSFCNDPLATVVEFVLDPENMVFYAISEKQTEKLFHMASNEKVSLGYMRQFEHGNYFKDSLGVQVKGIATLIKGTNPEFEAAAKIYMPSLGIPLTPELMEGMKKTKIITKVVPSRIALMDRNTHKSKGYHALQVWFSEDQKK